MRKISMGGFGVINLEKLYSQKTVFGFFAQQLTYPEKSTYHTKLFEESIQVDDPAYPFIKQYWENVQSYSLEQLQELYVQTFDFHKKATLYMTFFKFEDAKERGQMLAKLKVMYEMFGLEMPSGELSDYLPLISEFLYAAEWLGDSRAEDSFNILMAVLEDGTYHLLQGLEEINSVYYPLVKGFRETLKACLQEEVMSNEHD